MGPTLKLKKSWRGVGGEGAAPPPQCTRCKECIAGVDLVVVVVVVVVVKYSSTTTRPEDQGTRGQEDRGARGPEDQGTGGPGDQRTKKKKKCPPPQKKKNKKIPPPLNFDQRAPHIPTHLLSPLSSA